MKRYLRAASLVEALVASVIFLIVFFIAMNSIVNISKVNVVYQNILEIETKISDCVRCFQDMRDSTRLYDYDWGTIELCAKPYNTVEELYELSVIVRCAEHNIIVYNYLVAKDEGEI